MVGHNPPPSPSLDPQAGVLGNTPLGVLLLHKAAPSNGTAPGTETIPLRAGSLSMMFEPEHAFLRYIKAGPHELLRGINAPVRDRFWGTVLPVVTGLVVEDEGDHFGLRFDATCKDQEVDFSWHGSIRGTADGQIEFTFNGTARSTFLRNRIGFCVLHSPSAAGRPWILETTRGEKVTGRFPEFISPHQPAKNIRKIAHELEPGVWVHVGLEGDTFEMEDQRNWTDASFKTYCTPLELPYPVLVVQGTRVVQKVVVRLQGTPSAGKGLKSARPVLTLHKQETLLPPLGLQVSSQAGELSRTERVRLKALRLEHLRADLTLSHPDFSNQLRRASTQARSLGLNLQVGLRLGDEPDAALDALIAAARSIRPPVTVWWIIGADETLHQRARARLGELGARAKVGSLPEDSSFTQLNRVRPTPSMRELVGYGVTPQIHAFDNRSIMETLTTLGDTVRSARQFIGDCPLMITPVTLRRQALPQPPLPGELPSNVDPRQRSGFAAAWTLGCIKYLSEAGVESITCYETVGWKGIMESVSGPILASRFPSAPGEAFPIYTLLREVGEFRGARVQHLESSDPLAVAGLALRKGGRRRLLIANLTDKTLFPELRGWEGSLQVRKEDAHPVKEHPAGRDDASLTLPETTLPIPPYAIVRIDLLR